MPVSPNVAAYMQQGEQGPANAENIFAEQFTSRAFDSLRAKFPSLVKRVAQFRVLSSDLRDSKAFGIFMISAGDDLMYVPVTMSGGNISPCEIIYNKTEDLFEPLNSAAVRKIVNLNEYTDPSVLRKDVKVEDTKELFKNMFRPPVSSNVVLAGEHVGIESLPNAYKEVVSNWLCQGDSTALRKISNFYPVEEIATKLASTAEQTVPAVEDACLPDFLRLDTLTQKTAALLADSDKKQLLADGYLVKSGSDFDSKAVSTADFSTIDSGWCGLETYPGIITDAEKSRIEYTKRLKEQHSQDNDSGKLTGLTAEKALMAVARDGAVTRIPVLLCGQDVVTGDSYIRLGGGTVLVSDRSTDVSKDDLESFNAIFGISNLIPTIRALPGDPHLHFHIFVPKRGGGYMFLDLEDFFCGSADGFKRAVIGDETSFLRGGTSDSAVITITKDLECGFMQSGNRLLIPEGSYFMHSYINPSLVVQGISSFEELRKYVQIGSRVLTNVHDGVVRNITDLKTQKTASFASDVDAADYLHQTYGLDGSGIHTVLGSPKSYIFEKTALSQAIDGTLETSDQQETAAPNPASNFDPKAIEAAAELNEPDFVDAGIMASFANDPDIKSLLVQYLPEFIKAQDRLGRVLLLFNYQKKELEDFFGQEKYSELSSACRKIFTVVGDLVASLKTYVHMN